MLHLIKKILGIKTKVTEKEMADIYWHICRNLSKALDTDLRQSLEEYKISPESFDNLFMLEQVIFNLWIISKTCPTDKKVLDELHDQLIKKLPNLFDGNTDKADGIWSLVAERYKQYYAAWDKPDGLGPGHSVAATFLKNICEKFNREIRFYVMAFPIAVHIMSGMKFILETRKNYVVIS